MKVHEKTAKTAIIQDLSLDLNPFEYLIVSKTNATFHPNIDSFKTAIKEEWNRMSEEFILKAFKSSQRRIDTIIEKKKKKSIWVNLLFFQIFFIDLLILLFVF